MTTVEKVVGVYADLQARMVELGLLGEDGDTVVVEAKVSRISTVGPDIDRDPAEWTIVWEPEA